MIPVSTLEEQLIKGTFDENLRAVYVTEDQIADQRKRHAKAVKEFAELFGSEREAGIYSAPGRTEVGGNHTDHNFGKVLAASVNLDAIAVASPNGENVVRVKSAGYDMDVVDLNDLTPHEDDFGDSSALLRGMCARMKAMGYQIGGFDAYTTSQVLSGSGLSSSAAYEVLLGTIINHMFNNGAVDAVTIAQIAQYAENVFFGKPCGLMDQMASSVGSFVTIDFENPEKPVIKKVEFDFASCGHSLCIVDTGGNHADLTGDYAAVRAEMESVAGAMGRKVLREVEEEAFYEKLPMLRSRLGDRAVLRAMHFFGDNRRVEQEVAALESNDFDAFKELVIASGRSSYMYNQNVFTCKNAKEQGVSLALAMAERLLGGKGAWRVHGGGFAGTMQAFVPNDMLEEYKAAMEAVFGEGTCYVLSIRPVGGYKIVD